MYVFILPWVLVCFSFPVRFHVLHVSACHSFQGHPRPRNFNSDCYYGIPSHHNCYVSSSSDLGTHVHLCCRSSSRTFPRLDPLTPLLVTRAYICRMCTYIHRSGPSAHIPTPHVYSSSMASRAAFAATSASAWSSGGTSLCMRPVSSEIQLSSISSGLSLAGSC